MIEKIVRLRGIGLLHDPLSSGSLQLKPVTVIYAENGRGKSTFAAVCCSLSTGNPQPISDRKTIHGTYEPEVHFRISNQSYQFRDREWTSACSDILVFDEHFIETNVSIGSRIDPYHRENLLEFAIGEEGVRLKSEIDGINKAIEQVNKDLRTLGEIISQHKGPFTLEEFIQLEPQSDIDVRLEEMQQQLQDAEKIEAICQRPVPEHIQLPEFDLRHIEQLLVASLETVAKEAEREVKDHIKRHLDAYGEKWLRQGLNYLGETVICPFCGQNVDGLALIEAYKQYFSEAYDRFKYQIEEALQLIEKQFSDGVWASIESKLKLNNTAKGSWADRPDLRFPEGLDQSALRSIFMSLRNKAIGVLRKKLSAPLSKIFNPEELYRAAREYETVRSQVDSYNKAIEDVRTAIDQLKDSLGKVDKKQLQFEIKRLESKKKRFQSEVDDYCQRYQELQREKHELEKCKSQKREELTKYTDEILKSYKDEINDLLHKFNAGFTISEIEVTHVKGTPRTEYRLQLMGENISVSSQSGRAFSTTLSSGDRKTLALAFFLARLKLDPQLDQRIVIVDDPISSLDTARRRATCDILAWLANKCTQLVVLSHDAPFLRKLLEDVDQGNSCAFQIIRRGEYSVIEACDIYRMCREEYYLIYESLIKYLEEGPKDNESKIAGDIRKYLEHNLRNRFPVELEGTRTLGDIIRRIENSPERFGGLADQLEELCTLNDFSSPYHHLASDHPLPPSDAELKQMVKLALEIGRGA